MKEAPNVTAKGQAIPPEKVIKTGVYSVAEITAWSKDDTFAEGEQLNLARRLAGDEKPLTKSLTVPGTSTYSPKRY
jgi:hypothetical protein